MEIILCHIALDSHENSVIPPVVCSGESGCFTLLRAGEFIDPCVSLWFSREFEFWPGLYVSVLMVLVDKGL